MNSYILTAYLMMPSPVYADNSQEALKYVGKAMYKELKIDKAVKRLEKRYIPEDFKPYIGYTGTVVRIITEKKITYVWRF